MSVSVFERMSLAAAKHGAVNLGQGFPDFGWPDEILDAAAATGITLTDSLAMHPAASVCGLYFSHPDARYFAVDRISREQVADYARRKGMSVEEAERWLAPNLGYESS